MVYRRGHRQIKNIAKGLLISILVLTGCSHTDPYYGSQSMVEKKVNPSGRNLSLRVLLIGDTGLAKPTEPVLIKLTEWAEKAPTKTIVLFLGDNIYPNGLPSTTDSGYVKAQERLDAQLSIMDQSKAFGIFIPGNHDWASGGKEGLQFIRRQAEYINDVLPEDQNFFPSNGCPGPEKLDLVPLRIIFLDTHWWLHKWEKGTSSCSFQTKEESLAGLLEFLQTAGKRRVLVVGHHPLNSHGPHGGFFDWIDHIFPLVRLDDRLWIPFPVLGSVAQFVRWFMVRSDQDLVGPLNKEMVFDLKKVFSRSPPFIYASGHDHNLQVLSGTPLVDYFLISGLGSSQKATSVGHGADTIFAHLHPGFMALDFWEDDKVLLQVVEPDKAVPVFSKILELSPH